MLKYAVATKSHELSPKWNGVPHMIVATMAVLLEVRSPHDKNLHEIPKDKKADESTDKA